MSVDMICMNNILVCENRLKLQDLVRRDVWYGRQGCEAGHYVLCFSGAQASRHNKVNPAEGVAGLGDGSFWPGSRLACEVRFSVDEKTEQSCGVCLSARLATFTRLDLILPLAALSSIAEAIGSVSSTTVLKIGIRPDGNSSY